MRKVNIIIAIVLLLMVGAGTFLFSVYGNLVKSFIYPPQENVNILVLGKGGVGHEAPDLTDTVIFISISDKKISLISLPRDIWVPEIRAKLNSAYYWGKLPLTKTTVQKMVGVPIQYGLVIDFSGFRKIVDALGGVEIDVQNAFTDEKYPIAGKENDSCMPCRYETVKFKKGKQIMDGETALKFVRSRNAEGDEGTDAARAARQQLVIDAIKNKVVSNPWKILALKNAVMQSLETDIDSNVLAGILGLVKRAKGNLVTVSIPEEFLINPPVSRRYDNQYVFIPKAGDWSEVQKWIQSRID